MRALAAAALRRTQEPAKAELAEDRECEECCLCPERGRLAA